MTVKSTLRQAADRNQAKTNERMDKYFSALSSALGRSNALLAKLPAGERVAHYLAKTIDAQQEAMRRYVDKQEKLQNWVLRERSGDVRMSSPAAKRKAGTAPAKQKASAAPANRKAATRPTKPARLRSSATT